MRDNLGGMRCLDGASHAIDALAGRELEVVDGKVSLDIQPFRMVLIKAW